MAYPARLTAIGPIKRAQHRVRSHGEVERQYAHGVDVDAIYRCMCVSPAQTTTEGTGNRKREPKHIAQTKAEHVPSVGCDNNAKQQ